MKKILVLGCRRSGTTLLASLLGAHSQINMINEGYGDEINSLVGKPYQAVKLGYPHIQLNKRYSRIHRLLYHKVSFIRNLLLKIGLYWNVKHGSKYSIRDYEKMGAKLIIIHRTRKDNVNSMINRSKMPRKQAEHDWDKFQDIRYKVKGLNILLKELTTYPEYTLKLICEYIGIEFESQMLNAAGFNNTYNNSTIEQKQ